MEVRAQRLPPSTVAMPGPSWTGSTTYRRCKPSSLRATSSRARTLAIPPSTASKGPLVCRGDGDITPWCAFGIKVDTDTLEDHSDGSVDAAACLAVPCTGGHSNMQSLAVDTVVALDPDTEFTGVDFDDSLVMCGWALGNAHASADSSYTSLIASLSVRRYDAQIGYLDPYRS